jgi:hypothetical protein
MGEALESPVLHQIQGGQTVQARLDVLQLSGAQFLEVAAQRPACLYIVDQGVDCELLGQIRIETRRGASPAP